MIRAVRWWLASLVLGKKEWVRLRDVLVADRDKSMRGAAAGWVAETRFLAWHIVNIERRYRQAREHMGGDSELLMSSIDDAMRYVSEELMPRLDEFTRAAARAVPACELCGGAGRVDAGGTPDIACPQCSPNAAPAPGPCGDLECHVLHADPANPIHPPFYTDSRNRDG